MYNFSKLNCSSLCGVPIKRTVHAGSDISNEKIMSVNLDGECVCKSQLSIGSWEKSARRFMQLINMNDTSFDCPKWNSVYHKPNETELPKFWARRYFEDVHNGKRSRNESSFKTSVVEPDGIPGRCNVTIDRGVERDNDVYLIDANIQHGGNPSRTIGTVISLWVMPHSGYFKMQRFPVHLQHHGPNGCRGDGCAAHETMWLPASTFGTSVPYKENATQHYSIFAKWNFDQIPGIEGMMVKLRKSVSHLENDVDELSPSNIAILGLPLLLAIPPISLMDAFLV